MKPAPWLVVVSGLPASGKSSLARALGSLLGLPVISKDDYKEALADALPELENGRLGPLSFELMYLVADRVLRAGVGALLETHFYLGMSEPRLLRLAEANGARLAQVYCHAPPDLLRERDRARLLSGTRHRTHSGIEWWDALPASVGRRPLALDAPLLELDTSDFARLDAQGVAGWLRAALTSP